MVEEERTYEVDAAFVVPHLAACLPSGGQAVARRSRALRATYYYDTADLRLTRHGASLRLRRGDRLPWTVKLPTDVPCVSRPWSRLGYGADGVSGASHLDPLGPDEQWHAVRVHAKRARYAIEAVADVLGAPARELGRAVAAVQDLLGEHRDAALAAQTWLAIAREDPGDHTLAVTAGQLQERERAVVRRMRRRFPGAWHATGRPRLLKWLP